MPSVLLAETGEAGEQKAYSVCCSISKPHQMEHLLFYKGGKDLMSDHPDIGVLLPRLTLGNPNNI